MKNKDRQMFVDYLEKLFPNAVCELNYNTPFELLVAVILSAQCTDKRVNLTTPKLFSKFSTPQDFANANIDDIEQIIKPCGFYHNKAKNIKNASIQIVEKFNGELPTNISDMMSLSGVGMKTAKVVCSVLYNEKVIAVDTHVRRITNRIGFVNEQNPDKCSVLLEKIFKDDLSKIHHRMVFFGRYHCKAIKPNCGECQLKSICKYYKNLGK